MKQRSFVQKHENWYSDYNHGKSHRQRRRNKRLGEKKIRLLSKKIIQEIY